MHQRLLSRSPHHAEGDDEDLFAIPTPIGTRVWKRSATATGE